jgi:hypothetical protein
VFVATKMK